MANYISNKEFTAAIDEYIKSCEAAESVGLEAPVIPDAVARQFIVLANKLGSRYNFAGYTFRDEMVSSAIFACCAKIRKFNILVSTNAFAYFTNVCWRAMVDVINAEETMSYIKAKSFEFVDYEDSLDSTDLSDFSDFSGNSSDYTPYFDVAAYETKMQARKDKARATPKKPYDGIVLEME